MHLCERQFSSASPQEAPREPLQLRAEPEEAVVRDVQDAHQRRPRLCRLAQRTQRPGREVLPHGGESRRAVDDLSASLSRMEAVSMA